MTPSTPTPCHLPADSDNPTPTPATSLDAWLHSQLARASMGQSPIALGLAFSDWLMHMGVSPGRQYELGVQALKQWLQWLEDQAEHLKADGPGPNQAPQADERFTNPAWAQWPYSLWRDAFLNSAKWWEQASQVDGMSRHHQQLVHFYARQWLDALSPSNSPVLNPQVQQHAWQTLGGSWWTGLSKLGLDAMSGLGASVAQADLPYAVGKDVAATPGEVVFRNHLFELIQYHPSTAKVRAEPLLIVPSTIMKYYILDLSAHNSMVRYLVSQGFTVYIMSWRNPDAEDRRLGMDDYLIDGVMHALHQARRLSQAKRIHAMGYCLGGTFLAIVAALMGGMPGSAGRRHALRAAAASPWPAELPELASVTLLAAQTDFSEPGELGLFIDEDQLRTIREEMARTGYLSGRQMAGAFQFLNSRDLIWSRHVNRHLLGQEEVGNDMMSWNADTTRLPERMHNEYLQQLFLDNALRNGHYKVAGQSVALENIAAPLMVVGTEKDHVSPWRSVFKILLDSQVDTDFILASGGHNAGIVSEPGHAHRHYRVGRQAAGQPWVDPENWVASTPCQPGSWWTVWAQWLHMRSAPQKVPARVISPRQRRARAPGEYVMVRYKD